MDKYDFGDCEVDEESIRIEIYNFKKELEQGTEEVTSIDQIEQVFLDDLLGNP